MRSSPVYGTLGVILVLLPQSATGQRRYTGEDRGSVLQQVRSASAQERASARAQLKAERRETIDFLLEIAGMDTEEPPFVYERLYAVELLGEFRAVEACRWLVDHVEYSPSCSFIGEVHPLNRFPAAKALVEIGEPAIREILSARMTKPVCDQEFKLFAWIIRLHYGPMHEEEVGAYRIRRLLQEEKAKRETYSTQRGIGFSPSAREKNLARLVETYEKINPTDPDDWPGP